MPAIRELIAVACCFHSSSLLVEATDGGAAALRQVGEGANQTQRFDRREMLKTAQHPVVALVCIQQAGFKDREKAIALPGSSVPSKFKKCRCEIDCGLDRARCLCC